MVLILLIYWSNEFDPTKRLWSNEFDPTKRLRRRVIIFSDQLNRVSLFRAVVRAGGNDRQGWWKCNKVVAVRRIGMTGLT
jgi:hypothetical protein